MRLMHLGFRSYVVGDTITPAFSENDLLIIGSGSGETRTLISIAIKAKEIGGKITLISTREKSTLSKLSCDTIIIPAYTDKVDEPSQRKPLLPGGSLFEEALLVLLDSVVLPLSEVHSIPHDQSIFTPCELGITMKDTFVELTLGGQILRSCSWIVKRQS